MSVVALTVDQAAAVQTLVQQGKLRTVPPDSTRAAKCLEIADERLAELPTITSAIVRLGVAYDAAHDVGEALLAAYGLATTNGPGQHVAMGEVLAIVIDHPPSAARAATAFELARRARNNQNYRGTPVGAKQAELIAEAAKRLREAATVRRVGT